MQKLAVGIITYNNTPDQLRQLSVSLNISFNTASEFISDIEVFILDNGEACRFPQLNCPHQKLPAMGNIGFSAGMNVLMKRAFQDASCDGFLCLNPDGVLHRRTLAEIANAAQHNPESLLEARQFPEEHPKTYHPETFETSWASGACLFVPRKINETVGAFDENFFMYLEDVDFSWRVRSAGYTVKVVPNALFGHAVMNRKPSRETTKFMLLSARYLAKKWGNLEFRKWAESELINQEFFTGIQEMPPIAKTTASDQPRNNKMADFEHLFHFSTARW